MDYENFKAKLMEDIQKQMYESGMEVSVSEQQIEKPSESYKAISVMQEGKDVGVNINIDHYYEQYKDGMPYSDVLVSTVGVVEKRLEDGNKIDVSKLYNYEEMKQKLSMEVIAIGGNEDYLTKIPHREMEDMAVIYRFVLDSTDGTMASIVVKNEQLKLYGITEEELHADALANAPKIRPAVIENLAEAIMEMMGDESMTLAPVPQDVNDMMYVASVPDRIHGAGVIAYQDFMEQAAQKLGGDFYILPSSIHEVMLLKDDGDINFRDLELTVRDVNEKKLKPEERLTDSVYHYDSKEHVFELASRFEERMQEKGNTKEKDSLLAGLHEKAAVAAQVPRKEKSDAVKAREGTAI